MSEHNPNIPPPPKSFKYITKPDIGTGLLSTEEIHGRIGLTFTPNVYPSRQINSIGFSRWENGAWHQASPSVNKGAVNQVVKLFGNVTIDPFVEALLHPDVQELPSAILTNNELYDFQKETIQFQLTAKHCLVALAPRLGKTVTSIFAADAANCKNILVISPLSLLFDWKTKIKKWSGTEDIAICYKKQLIAPARWTITNYDTVRIHPGKFSNEEWDCIIIDESLLVKNRNAKRTKVIQNLVRNTKAEYVWLLSGAPISRFYDDLWAQLKTIDPHRFSSYWRFAEQYCVVESNEWSKYNLIGNQPDAAERIKDDLSDIYFHRNQEDVLDLPPWKIENIGIPMGKAQDKLYQQMEEEFLAELGEDNTVLASNQLAQMVRLVQIASNPILLGGKSASAKWDAAIEMLSFEELPCIIWTSFIETAELLQSKLLNAGYITKMLTGQTVAKIRPYIVDNFQTGKLDVLIAHPAVGKYGLDLFAARTVIYLERGYNGDDYYQSLNRVRHVDAEYSPHILHLISERYGENKGGTIDHVIDKVLESRRDSVRKLTALDVRNLFEEAICINHTDLRL